MKTVKNRKGKTVCFVDERTSTVEILKDGILTINQFMSDVIIKNTNTAT